MISINYIYNLSDYFRKKIYKSWKYVKENVAPLGGMNTAIALSANILNKNIELVLELCFGDD